MKLILFLVALILISITFAQKVSYPPAPASVYKPYHQIVTASNQLKNTLWSNDVSDTLEWSFSNSSVPVNNWFIASDASVISTSGPFQAATAPNGFLVFQSDTLSGASSDAYVEFVGAQIDLTGEANIRMQFDQQFISDSNMRIVEVSPDGIAWTPFVISDGLTPTGEKMDDLVSINITSVAGNANDLHFRFHFSGTQEGYWAIDDIELRSIDSVDLRAVSLDWGTTGAWGVRMPYYSLVQSQIVPIEFCAVVENEGLIDIDSAVYAVQIAPSGFNQADTFSIQSGTTDTICLGTTFLTPGNPLNTCSQSILSDLPELDITDNDFEDVEFVVEQYYNNIYGRDDFLNDIEGGILEDEELGIEYLVGNVYDIFSNDYTHGISVRIHPDAPLDTELFGFLYVYEDSINDWVLINQTFNYTYNLSTSVSGWDIQLNFAYTSEPFQLLADHSYLVMVGTYSWGNSNTVFATSGKSKPNTSFYEVWTSSNVERTYITETPMVRLLFNPGSLEDFESNFNFNIAPNPSNKSTELSFELPASSEVSIELIDLSGKSIQQLVPKQCFEGRNEFQLETEDVLNGVYFVKLTTNFGSTTKRIIIQH